MTQSRNPGTNLTNSAANYSIFYDSTGFYCRNNYMGNPFIEFTALGSTASLHTVFNAAATALGTGTGYTTCGGLIELQTPKGKILPTRMPLILQNQVTLRGGGSSTIIQIQGPASNWKPSSGAVGPGNVGIHAGTTDDPSAVIDGILKSKVRVEEVTIDCNSYLGSTGIAFVKGSGGNVGGNNAHSYFLWNEVRNFDITGTQLSVTNPPGGFPSATSTSWWIGNQILDNSGNNAIGMAYYTGDAHVGPGSNIKMAVGGANGYCAYLKNAGSVHWTGPIHVVNNGNNSNGLITIGSGGNISITRVYFDNVDNNQCAVALATSGSANRTMIWNNWIHNTNTGQQADGSPGVISGSPPHNNAVVGSSGIETYMFRIENGGSYGTNISNNSCEWSNGGDDAGPHPLAAMLKITNASGKNAEDSLTFSGNTCQFSDNFTLIDGNIDTAPGVGTASNVIDDSASGGTSIRIGPGATPTTLEYPIASFTLSGTLSTGNGQFRVYIDGAWTITKVRASVGTAPVGNGIRIDIDKNSPSPYGTGSIFSSTGNQPTIAAAGFTNQKTAFSTSSLANADYLTCDIDTVGSNGTEGSNLTVQVFGTPA